MHTHVSISIYPVPSSWCKYRNKLFTFTMQNYSPTKRAISCCWRVPATHFRCRPVRGTRAARHPRTQPDLCGTLRQACCGDRMVPWSWKRPDGRSRLNWNRSAHRLIGKCLDRRFVNSVYCSAQNAHQKFNPLRDTECLNQSCFPKRTIWFVNKQL